MAPGGFGGGTAVITGAGSGLGAAMARRFAAEGMAIVALDIDEEGAAATASRIREGGGKALSLKVDAADRAALLAAAQRAEAAFGPCSVLCANVGVQQFGAIDRLTEQDWRWVLEVNVLGVVNTVHAFLPQLRAAAGHAAGFRRIVVTASDAAYLPGIRMAAYTASKYAVTGYAETLRMELEPEGIGVSILFPAGMATTHLQSSRKARPAEFGPSELRRDDIDAMLASRRTDVAGAVVTADYATRHLIEALAANQRYIITHGECRAVLTENFEALLAAHDRGQLP